MKQKAFTLVELLAVILLIGLIAGIAIPSVTKIVENRKKKLYELTIKELKNIAKTYAANNPDVYVTVDEMGYLYIPIGKLCDESYINCPVINPKNNREITGSILIKAVDESYTYEYTDDSQYVITFVNEDGTQLQIINAAYGEIPIYSGDTPTKNRTQKYIYTFKGWSPTIEEVTESATYTAVFDSQVDEQYALYETLLALDEKIKNFENTANGKLNTIEENITSANNTYTSFTSNYGKNVYPVGSIFISYDSTNPGTLFGGTWEVFGSGRSLVGINTGDSDFNTSGKTGGSKTATLSVSQIPSHTHTFTGTAHSHVVASDTIKALAATSGFDVGISSDTRTVWSNSGTADKYFFYVTKDSYKGGAGEKNTNAITTAGTNANTGGSGAHNNMQPYIVTHMWKRIA